MLDHRKLINGTLFVLSVVLVVGSVNIIRRSMNNEDEQVITYPTKGIILDDAALLTALQQQWLGQYHAAIRHAYDIDMRIATRADLKNIDTHTAQLFRELQIGTQSRTGRGLLLLIDPVRSMVRLEVGRNLEGVYTDAFVKYIQERQMVPFFQANRVSDGILATTELIAGRANEAQEGKAFDETAMDVFEPSTGAGAKSKARIGEGYEDAGDEGQARKVRLSGSSPSHVFSAYIQTLQEGMKSRDPAIYSKDSIAFFRGRVATSAQAKREYSSLEKCTQRQEMISGERAVIRHAVADRQCNPYFFVKEQGAWKLHFPDMAKYIRFNHKNEWHFDRAVPNAYAFAFKDWSFDSHFFPVASNSSALALNSLGTQPVYSPCKRFNAIYETDRSGYSSVVWISPKGAAYAMGLRYKDIIRYWGKEAPNAQEIVRYNQQAKPGENMLIRFIRDGKEMEINAPAPPYPLQEGCR